MADESRLRIRTFHQDKCVVSSLVASPEVSIMPVDLRSQLLDRSLRLRPTKAEEAIAALAVDREGAGVAGDQKLAVRMMPMRHDSWNRLRA